MDVIDEEETVGLLYQGDGDSSGKKRDPFLRNRPSNPGAWKLAAAWTFFTFFSVFLSLLVVKVVTNNLVGSDSASSSSTAQSNSVSSSSKPNFIFVLADDIGYGVLNEEIAPFTPNLSKMAQEGIFMANYYSQELCAPSRAALLTGRYPSHLGIQFGQFMPTANGGLTLDATLLPAVLKDNANYKSYAFGKWNLGHSSPNYLPTARGFDYYLGYLTTQNTYWTKSMAQYSGMHDFLEASTEGYWPYAGDDMSTYSTHFYRDHAKAAIKSHDFAQQPMFMYLAFQAAHPPFEDIDGHLTGLTEDDVDNSLWTLANNFTAGHHRQQYVMSIALLDSAVQEIWETVEEVGQADNTYLIFTSDNGGCPQDGGTNEPLRGTKGTLFEGGTRVNAFVYHTSFQTQGYAREYAGLMHITDWMPSMLSLAGIDTSIVKEMDGADHTPFWLSSTKEKTSTADGPREYMIYNYYWNVESTYLDKAINASVAVRNKQFKLIHAFVDSGYDGWHSIQSSTLEDNDDRLVLGPRCTESTAMATGTFTYMLFDLVNDPNELTNLYDDAQYEATKVRFLCAPLLCVSLTLTIKCTIE